MFLFPSTCSFFDAIRGHLICLQLVFPRSMSVKLVRSRSGAYFIVGSIPILSSRKSTSSSPRQRFSNQWVRISDGEHSNRIGYVTKGSGGYYHVKLMTKKIVIHKRWHQLTCSQHLLTSPLLASTTSAVTSSSSSPPSSSPFPASPSTAPIAPLLLILYQVARNA